MATPSPLAAALKPSLPVDGESEAKYQSALSQLSAALEKRKNLPGDAADIGYLAGLNDPSVRGMGFFAEFASGLRGARAAQLEQAKEEQDIASLRLQIAQSEREAARRKAASQTIQSVLTGQQPTPGAPVAGAPAAAGAAAPARSTGAAPTITRGDATGLGVIAPNGAQITPGFILAFKQANPEEGKQLDEYYKQIIDSIAVQPGGYVNKLTGEYTPFSGKAPVTRFIPGAAGQKAMTLELSEEDAMALDRARRTGDSETFYRIVDMYTKAPARPGAPTAAAPGAAIASGAPGAAPAGAARPAGSGSFAQTPSEAKAAQEVETEAAKAEAKILAEGRAKRFENVMTSAEDTGSRLALYKSLDSIVAKPNSEKIFGIFNRPDFMAGVGKLLETGVGLTGYSIGIPEIQNVMRNIGLPQEQINDYQLAASLFAQMQLQFSRLQQGQGSVSDFERRLYGTGSVTGEDNPGTIRKKLAMLTARAEFERSVAKALRASKLNADDFKDSDQYKNLIDGYHDRLVNIVSTPSVRPAGARPATPGAPAAAGAAPAASTPITADSLRERLNRQRSNP
jgi:hypothetical protein